MEEQDNNILSTISYLFLGAVIGAVIALLFAPQSGDETRNLLKDKSSDLKDKAIDSVGQTRERATQVISDSQSRAGDVWNEARKWFGEKVQRTNDGQNDPNRIAAKAETKQTRSENY